MGLYPAGVQIASTPLTGAEKVVIDGGGAQFTECTTADIAQLGSSGAPTVATPITTVGNGTLTAAAIVGGVILRSGSAAAYSDATDSAANIIAAIPSPSIGDSFFVTIKNTTAFAETLTAGANVTLPTTVIVPANSAATYLVTLTSLAAVTFTHIQTVLTVGITPAQFSTAALAVGTLAAGLITGAAHVVLQNTGATPAAQTTRTAAQMLADFVGARVGMSYMLRIVNTGAGTLTLTGDASVTVTGHAAVVNNTFVDYVVTFNSPVTATIQSVGSGTSP